MVISNLAATDDTVGERLIEECPVTVRRRVLWGECDPAGVVYTPRFGDYLTSAYGWFSRLLLTPALMVDLDGEPLMTPMKALSLEFAHVLKPQELFDMRVMVSNVRTRTFDLVVEGRSPEGEPRFTGRLTPIVCDRTFRSTPLPEPVANALAAYRDRCRVPG